MLVFLVAFCSRGGFHETANKSWTNWWTEIMFCLLDFTLCFPSLVHSLFITLCTVSLGSVPYSNWMVLGTVTLHFPVVTRKLRFSSVLWMLAFSCRKGDSPGTPKSHRFTTDPVLGWGSYALFSSVFEHQIF